MPATNARALDAASRELREDLARKASIAAVQSFVRKQRLAAAEHASVHWLSGWQLAARRQRAFVEHWVVVRPEQTVRRETQSCPVQEHAWLAVHVELLSKDRQESTAMTQAVFHAQRESLDAFTAVFAEHVVAAISLSHVSWATTPR